MRAEPDMASRPMGATIRAPAFEAVGLSESHVPSIPDYPIWRNRPDFPPKSTVWRYFDEWRHNGTLDTIHDLLRRKVRTMEKPYHPRTSASVDSQSVDTTSGGEQRGRDNAKNVDGRKHHIVVDSMGLLLA